MISRRASQPMAGGRRQEEAGLGAIWGRCGSVGSMPLWKGAVSRLASFYRTVANVRAGLLSAAETRRTQEIDLRDLHSMPIYHFVAP